MRKCAFFAACLLLAPAALAQGMDYAKTSEQVIRLGGGLFAIIATNPDPSSGIGDTTVALGSDGVILVDSQFDQLHELLKAQLAGVAGRPVKYVINTHAHGDHSGGNAAFAREGAIIVAHENVRKAMAAAKNTPKDAIPTQTYSGQGTEISIPGQKAELVHLDQPAHTNGDTIVFWPAADVISAGDTVHYPGYPNIDTASGGSIDGMIAAVDYILAHSDDRTRIVPGHGDVINRIQLMRYRTMLKTARDRIAAAKARGMTEDQVAKANLLADQDKFWKIPGNGASERFPINVYRGLK